jgi:hypothetical protein
MYINNTTMHNHSIIIRIQSMILCSITRYLNTMHHTEIKVDIEVEDEVEEDLDEVEDQ